MTALVLIVGVPSATAVHDLGLFELDENAVAEGAPGDDWETLAGGGGSALLDTFVTDPVESPTDEILDGGQTKDTENLDEWFWKGAEPNDKNDIEHAFAAAYEHPATGDLIIYFGLDRMDNSGDAAAGFWFLKKPVEQKTIDSDGDGDTESVFVFEGTNTLATHSKGDTLVQTNFTNGGSISRINAYQWDVAPAGSPVQPGSPLRNIATGADCDVAVAGDLLCGQANRNSETVPANWPQQTVGSTTASYFFKGQGGVAPSTTFPTATFFEGGLNATELLGADFCAAQMLAETRQSQSETSTLEDKAEAAFNLCSIAVTKTGPEKSKIGDDATYEIKVTNTGAVTLYKQSIVDDVIGNLTGNAGCGASLAPGASCTITVDHTVPSGAPDPLVNTVSVIYNRKSDLLGDQVTDSASHSVDLFQPSVEVTKSGDTLSKVGDEVTYTFEIENTSSTDSPDLILDTIEDSVLGDLAEDAPAACDTLAPGATCSFNVNYAIAEGDPDPLVNTVTVHYHPDGFPNDITDSDDHSVNLFQPSVEVTKGGDTLSKVGDEVTYTFEVENTSSTDSPDLILDSISDSVLGDLADEAPAACDSLAPGDTCSFNVNYTIQAGDADPLENTVTVHYHPDGFPNDITDSDDHSVNLFQPSVEVTKGGDTLSKVGDEVTYTFEVENTSSTDSPNLILDTIEDSVLGDLAEDAPAACDTLAPGATCSFNVNYAIAEGDPDPLVNTVTVHYHPDGFPNDITDSDDHSVNLFQPSVDLVKEGDTLSKVGDEVTYSFTVHNTSSADSPDLILDSFTDTLLGDLLATAEIADCDVLEPGDSCNFTFTRVVKPEDPDPLPNTATVHYHPDGFPNDITDSDDHSVNLFQPSITFDKSGDGLSKVGDEVKYTLTLNNTSSGDSPALDCTITDTMLGIDKDVTLASGASDVIDKSYTVQPGDPDPLPNTADVTCSPQGFPNVLLADDSHSVNLFQPSLKVTKEAGNPYSKAGDPVEYTVTIENTSSADSPDLVIDTISDSLQGDLTDSANYDSSTCGASLVSGTSCVIGYTRTVEGGDPDPLENTVSVETHPDGFPNDVDNSDSVEVDLLHPAYTVTKDCKAGTEPVPQEGPALFTVVIANTGDADLVITADDGIGTVNLAAGESKSFQTSVAGPFTGQSTVENTVHTTAVLAEKYGLPNEYEKDATGDCRVGGRVNVVKTTQGGSAPVGGWTFKLYSGPDGFDGGTLLATDTTPPDTLDFGNLNLDPTKTYTVCEENVPAGWTSIWKVDTNGDGTADTIINPYNPNADDNPMADVGNRCIDFGAGTDFPIPAGGTLVFQVDNSFPGGEPRTPGYWKNWSSCTGGGQYANAIAKGGGAAGYWTLDELLNNPGFQIGDMVLNGVWNDDDYKFQNAPRNNDCVEAVRILDKSDAKDGKKRASDAAYELATALFAARLNFAAGAETCTAAQNAATAGQALLVSIGFNGTGSYLPSNVKGALLTKRNQALALANTLDQYNNGNIC